MKRITEIQYKKAKRTVNRYEEQQKNLNNKLLVEIYAEGIAIKTGFSIEKLRKETMTRDLVCSRMIVSYLVKKKYPYLSSEEIGEIINRDGSSVRTYFKKWDHYKTYPEISAMMDRVGNLN